MEIAPRILATRCRPSGRSPVPGSSKLVSENAPPELSPRPLPDPGMPSRGESSRAGAVARCSKSRIPPDRTAVVTNARANATLASSRATGRPPEGLPGAARGGAALIGRIGFSVGMLVALGIPTPAFAQDAPPLQRLPDSRFSIHDSRFSNPSKPDPDPITISGDLRLEYAIRDSAIEDLRARLAGLPPSGRGDDTFISADARLRFDVALPRVRFAAELAVLPHDAGAILALGGEG